MALQGNWWETLYSLPVAGAALANTVTATSLLPTAAHPKLTLPNNYFDRLGKGLKLRGLLQLSNLVTTPGTFTLDVRFGGTIVFNGGAMQMSSTAHTTLPVMFDIDLWARAIGSAANLFGIMRIAGQALSLTAVADSTTTPANLLAPNVTPAAGSNFDATAALAVDLFGAFSIANAANAVTLQALDIISPN